MIKEELISCVSNQTGYSRRIVAEILTNILKNITDELADGGDIVLRGFGTFEVKKKAQRTGRDISTDKQIKIPEKYAPVFRPSPYLKNLVSRQRVGRR